MLTIESKPTTHFFVAPALRFQFAFLGRCTVARSTPIVDRINTQQVRTGFFHFAFARQRRLLGALGALGLLVASRLVGFLFLLGLRIIQARNECRDVGDDIARDLVGFASLGGGSIVERLLARHRLPAWRQTWIDNDDDDDDDAPHLVPS